MSRLDALSNRRIDPDITDAKLLHEVYQRLNQSESVKYTIGAMQPIDSEYTKNTFVQGERVCNQLKNNLSTKCDYEYQGSVTNDTHIKARSDVDILTLTSKFHMLESPQKPKFPYKGDTIKDIIDLRNEEVKILRSVFPKASVDDSGSKSITVEGGSLTRKIDVVPSNWFFTNRYADDPKKIFKGVQILDIKTNVRVVNTPFLHNAWIEYKDGETLGNLRKAVRLMKSLKYDTENINLSSYDITSIAFNMPNSKLIVSYGFDLGILDSCLEWCLTLENDSDLRNSINVPDGHRKVFCDGHADLVGLRQLIKELKGLQTDILYENQRSFKKLAEARVEY